MRFFAPTRMLRDMCVFKHTGKASEEKYGKGTIAMKSDETRELIQLCIGWRPNNYVLCEESIQSGERQIRTREREKDHRKDLSSEDPEMIAIRTP